MTVLLILLSNISHDLLGMTSQIVEWIAFFKQIKSVKWIFNLQQFILDYYFFKDVLINARINKYFSKLK